MGFFLLGAFSTSILKGMKQNDWFGNESFLSGIKAAKREDKLLKKLSDEGK